MQIIAEQKEDSNYNVLVIRFALFFTYKYRQAVEISTNPDKTFRTIVLYKLLVLKDFPSGRTIVG